MATLPKVFEVMGHAASEDALDAGTQRRLYDWAKLFDLPEIVAALARRADLAEDLAELIAADRTFVVRRAWLARPRADLGKWRAELRAERNHKVLCHAARTLAEDFNGARYESSEAHATAAARLRAFIDEAPSLTALAEIVLNCPDQQLQVAALAEMHRAPGVLEHNREAALMSRVKASAELRTTFCEGRIHPSLVRWVPDVAGTVDLDPDTALRLWGLHADLVAEAAASPNGPVAYYLERSAILLADLPDRAAAVDALVGRLGELDPAGDAARASVELRRFAELLDVAAGDEPSQIAEAALAAVDLGVRKHSVVAKVVSTNRAAPVEALQSLLDTVSRHGFLRKEAFERPLPVHTAIAAAAWFRDPELLLRCGDLTTAVEALVERLEVEPDGVLVSELLRSGVLDDVDGEVRRKLVRTLPVGEHFGVAAVELAKLIMDTIDSNDRFQFAVEYAKGFGGSFGALTACSAVAA